MPSDKLPPGYMLVPIEPTRAMLRDMSRATFLSDGSSLEMVRRWNGALAALAKSRKHRAVIAAYGTEGVVPTPQKAVAWRMRGGWSPSRRGTMANRCTTCDAPAITGREVLVALDQEELAEVIAVLEERHGERDYEPECPACTGLQKLISAKLAHFTGEATDGVKENPNA